MTQKFDIIGDIHGKADALRDLLTKLGYKETGNCYHHPEDRKVIFVGDLIDRGKQNLEVVELARAMTRAGQAITVMGNHELNAIMYFRRDDAGNPIRPHTKEKRKQHQAFLEEVEESPDTWHDVISWFETLPLFYENDEFRVIHACWDNPTIEKTKPYLDENNALLSAHILDAGRKGSILYNFVETLLKGDERDLPNDIRFKDKDGNIRTNTRLQWWLGPETSFKDLALVPDLERAKLPNHPPDERVLYSDTKPVFIGHYWMSGGLRLQTDYVCCVDYSAGRKDRLCAYQWSSPGPLSVANLMTVPAR